MIVIYKADVVNFLFTYTFRLELNEIGIKYVLEVFVVEATELLLPSFYSNS